MVNRIEAGGSIPDQLIRLMAAREGHFLLESGHHGNLWLDLDRLSARPRRTARFATALAGRLAEHDIEVACGPLTGGAFVAHLVAARLDIAFCYTERFEVPPGDGLYPVGYRLPSSFRAAVRGRRVAVVDDAINAGSAVKGSLLALRECGAIPVAAGALLALGSSGGRQAVLDGLPLVTLASLPSNVWIPAACPLCASRVPLDRPGGEDSG